VAVGAFASAIAFGACAYIVYLLVTSPFMKRLMGPTSSTTPQRKQQFKRLMDDKKGENAKEAEGRGRAQSLPSCGEGIAMASSVPACNQDLEDGFGEESDESADGSAREVAEDIASPNETKEEERREESRSESESNESVFDEAAALERSSSAGSGVNSSHLSKDLRLVLAETQALSLEKEPTSLKQHRQPPPPPPPTRPHEPASERSESSRPKVAKASSSDSLDDDDEV